MSDYYDRQGRKITMHEWSGLFGDWEYKRLGNDDINNHTVSTVWLGMDHAFGQGPPLIFETMIFVSAGLDDRKLDNFCTRYATEEDALLAHSQLVYGIKHGIPFESLEELRMILKGLGETFGVDYPDEPKPEPPEEPSIIEI